MRRREPYRADGVGPDWFRARSLLSLALAVVFAFQGFLVNTHVHLPAPLPAGGSLIGHLATTAGLQTATAHDHKTQTPDGDGICVLCLAAALVGTYSLPPAVVVHQPADFLPLKRAYSARRHTVHAQHLAWQSRAPPVA